MLLFKRLPPLSALVFFEAAARLNSFSKAAHELCVTQSAVSKQIKSLEEDLGCQLFHRANPKLSLTEVGVSYLNDISPLLEKIADRSHALRVKNNSNEITIIATIAVAHYWLFPRVALFKNLFPSIHINIYSCDEIDAPSCLNYDLGILYSADSSFETLNSHHLFPERIYAVCGMGYKPLKETMLQPADLLHESLLHLDPQKWRWNNWKDWLAHFQVDYALPPGALIMNNFPLLLQAAIANMGVALGWGFAVEELIRNRLLRPVSESYFETHAADYLVYNKNRSLSPAAEAFRDWLLEGRVAGLPA